MSDDQGKAILLTTFFLAITLVVWSELKDQHRVPVPSRFVSAGLVWGALGIAAPFITYPLAGVLGMGMTVALFYQHWNIKRNPPTQADPIPNAPIPPPVSI